MEPTYIMNLLAMQGKLAKTQVESELKFAKVDISLMVKYHLCTEPNILGCTRMFPSIKLSKFSLQDLWLCHYTCPLIHSNESWIPCILVILLNLKLIL